MRIGGPGCTTGACRHAAAGGEGACFRHRVLRRHRRRRPGRSAGWPTGSITAAKMAVRPRQQWRGVCRFQAAAGDAGAPEGSPGGGTQAGRLCYWGAYSARRQVPPLPAFSSCRFCPSSVVLGPPFIKLTCILRRQACCRQLISQLPELLPH